MVPRAFGVVLLVAVWQVFVLVSGVQSLFFPSPLEVARALVEQWPVLLPSLIETIETTLVALAISVTAGFALAILMAWYGLVEMLLAPIAVILQVTPIVAIAPLILIYVERPWTAQLIVATLVSFFPMMLNTLEGLKSVDRNQADLLRTYGASGWQTLWYLKVPSARPNFFAGLKIASGWR